jgi:hypothetical protein
MKKIMLICFLFILNILIISQIVCSCSFFNYEITSITCNVKENYFDSELTCLNENCSINITKSNEEFFNLSYNNKIIFLRYFKDEKRINFNIGNFHDSLFVNGYFIKSEELIYTPLNDICIEDLEKYQVINHINVYFSTTIKKISFNDEDENKCQKYNDYITICAEETRLNKLDEIIDILIEDNHFVLSPLIKDFKNKKENFFDCYKKYIYIGITDDMISFNYYLGASKKAKIFHNKEHHLKDYCYYSIQEFCFNSHPKISHPELFIHLLKNPNKKTIPYLLLYLFVFLLFICFFIFTIYLHKNKKLKSFFLFNKYFYIIYFSLTIIIILVLSYLFILGYLLLHRILFYIILLYILICFGNYFYKKYKKTN